MFPGWNHGHEGTSSSVEEASSCRQGHEGTACSMSPGSCRRERLLCMLSHRFAIAIRVPSPIVSNSLRKDLVRVLCNEECHHPRPFEFELLIKVVCVWWKVSLKTRLANQANALYLSEARIPSSSTDPEPIAYFPYPAAPRTFHIIVSMRRWIY